MDTMLRPWLTLFNNLCMLNMNLQIIIHVVCLTATAGEDSTSVELSTLRIGVLGCVLFCLFLGVDCSLSSVILLFDGEQAPIHINCE